MSFGFGLRSKCRLHIHVAAGNVLIDDDNVSGLVDFGNVQRIPSKDRRK